MSVFSLLVPVTLSAQGSGDMRPRPGGATAFTLPAADSAAALHLLNRLAFGPRPGDISRVERIGIAAWLDEQLDPRRLPDVRGDVARRWPVAFLSPQQLVERYPPPNPQAAAARRPDPRDMENARPPRPGGPDSLMRQREARGYREMGAAVMMATLERHVASERQLLEVMTDFWTNHFNVFMGKQADRWLVSDYVETAIRPNALGSFETLLIAVARHPAMLVYLDNAMSVAPGATPEDMRRRPQIRIGRGGAGGAGRGGIGGGGRGGLPPQRMPPLGGQAPQPAQANQRPTGINENYARELLELHTLGVDGGYTQADVTDVARVLTGWSVRRPQDRGGDPLSFEFREWAHDRGEKTVLGERFPEGRGMDEGLRLLRMLAAHPATARHVSHKLCERLVSDAAPDGCVDHAVAAWRRSGGDIAAVVRAIVTTEDFWAEQNRAAKTKSPLEFLVSALRAIGATPDSTPRVVAALQQLGQPLFMQQVPTGYPETSDEWVNSGALLARMNIAVALAAGRLPGVVAAPEPIIPVTPQYEDLLARVDAVILGGRASPNTRSVIRRQLADIGDPVTARALAVGLALGSPEFQRQ
jgi:uncharacterized protein (DUF1800 family)